MFLPVCQNRRELFRLFRRRVDYIRVEIHDDPISIVRRWRERSVFCFVWRKESLLHALGHGVTWVRLNFQDISVRRNQHQKLKLDLIVVHF